MKRKLCCYFIVALLVVGFIACGGSDDEENLPTKTATPTTKATQPADDVLQEEVKVAVNFAAEEAQIRGLIKLHDDAVNTKDPDAVMEHWLGQGVFMAHSFFGGLVESKTWGKVRGTWKSIFARPNRWQMKTTIDKVGINAKGQEATASGNFQFLRNPLPLVMAFKKDKEGNWKIKKIDYGDQGFIKKINTPK